MDQEPNILRESAQVVREIEGQLEKVLQKRVDDIEKDLEFRINQERETARKKKVDIEKEFENERQTVADFRTMLQEVEEERKTLLDKARQHFDRVIQLQADIEGLAKATVEEIKTVNGIQHEIESLRERTAERAGFLKKSLRERFGISADVLDEGPKPLSLDLDKELEKLRKIKDLLAVESAAAGLGIGSGAAGGEEPFSPLEPCDEPKGIRIPEIQDLIAASHAPEEAPEEPEAERKAEPAPEAVPEPPAEPMPAGPESVADDAAALESLRKSEPANGNGEIIYFEKDGRIVLDGESIFAAVEKTMDEAQRLSLKLGMTESPKGQFFIKQELINWQEGLRSFFLRIIKMTEKKAWALSSHTSEILNATTLRNLLERLSMENWSNPDEFSSFLTAVTEMKNSFLARIEPRSRYLKSLRIDLESR